MRLGGAVSSIQQPSEWATSKAVPSDPGQPSGDCHPSLYPDYSLIRQHIPGPTSLATSAPSQKTQKMKSLILREKKKPYFEALSFTAAIDN